MKFLPLEYTFLRDLLDSRPRWAINLGLYEFSLNGEITKRVYPRLKYKKKLGSHIVNPKADEAYVKDQENKYLNYYKELSYKLHEVQNVQGHNNLLRKS